MSNNKQLLDKISQYSLVLSLFKFYKQTRLVYLIFKFIMLLVFIVSISWLCWSLIYGLSH
jgi:hypothetical protein